VTRDHSLNAEDTRTEARPNTLWGWLKRIKRLEGWYGLFKGEYRSSVHGGRADGAMTGSYAAIAVTIPIVAVQVAWPTLAKCYR
jgi:hypothetical protein